MVKWRQLFLSNDLEKQLKERHNNTIKEMRLTFQKVFLFQLICNKRTNKSKSQNLNDINEEREHY